MTEFPIELDSKSYAPDKAERTDGLHLSDILDNVEKALEPNKYKDHPFDLETCAALGFINERVIEREIVAARVEAGLLFRPGEIEKDGILMTPDGYDVNGVLNEWKATWRSMNREIESFARYWWQIKAYCYGLGVQKARLIVAFMAGNWRESGPRWKGWDAEFTKRELQENWQFIRNHAQSRGWL